MRKEKTAMTLSEKAIWTLLIVGIIRVFFGIASCFKIGHLDFISACLLFASSIISLSFLRIKTDKPDELSEKNLMESTYRADKIVELIIYFLFMIAIGIYFYLRNNDINGQISFPDVANLFIHIPYAFLGIKHILTGVFFIRREKE